MEEARILSEYARREREIPRDRYSPAQPAALFARQNTQRHVIALMARQGIWPPAALDVLDVGCGSGGWLQDFSRWGADPERLRGVDLIPDRVSAAKHNLPQSDIRECSAAALPWPDASFDLVTQFVVFTSILDPGIRSQAAREMLRVTRPGGVILWYDFRCNNPRNRNVRRVTLHEIQTLFPGCRVEAQSVTLAPPLAEIIAPLCWPLAHALESLPFLRTHLLCLIHPSPPKSLMAAP